MPLDAAAPARPSRAAHARSPAGIRSDKLKEEKASAAGGKKSTKKAALNVGRSGGSAGLDDVIYDEPLDDDYDCEPAGAGRDILLGQGYSVCARGVERAAPPGRTILFVWGVGSCCPYSVCYYTVHAGA